MKSAIKIVAAALLSLIAITNIEGRAKETAIWSIGQHDGSPEGFALAPDRFRDFIENDFGYEDKFFLVGASDASKDFPYVLPGPTDTWGGTWHTSGWRTHSVTILFGLENQPCPDCDYRLDVHLADFATEFAPLVKITINGVDKKFQLEKKGHRRADQRKPGLGEAVRDTLSLTGDLSGATPQTVSLSVKGKDLKKGGNQIIVTVLEGSWVLFDSVVLSGPASTKVQQVGEVFLRNIEPADYQLLEGQPLLVDAQHLNGSPRLEVRLDGKPILAKTIEKGRYILEALMPTVQAPTRSRYSILLDGKKIASGRVDRAPMPLRSKAGYVDTRIGSAHSRWMIAPGPWMPFSMVKMSPDNQNGGWQAGYQPSFESIGCFSHIHEWTLSGLGVMATNGPLKTVVGDEQDTAGGYRSAIDKRSEKAGIGLYSVHLTDYDIKAEVTATTRCSMERFTFPLDREDGRILVDFKPQAEYGVNIQGAALRQVSPTRLEGWCHQLSPNVWSNDADQDYTINFVIEFDRPVTSLGTWKDDTVTDAVDSFEWGGCASAGFFAVFDPSENPVVQVRCGISPVSVANASENLRAEVSEPFGWDFGAVVRNNIDTWEDLLSRIDIKTDDALEKTRFYTNMYRSLCSRNIWSDCNGQWISTDGAVRTVENPSDDVMLGCDAFWNTFWNLNQLWNMITPEWSNRWVRSQLAMYDANGWLAKGPAGLNYIPVMVAEHEIPLIVSAWQMGVRGFDPHKALEAAIKMQTTPAQKVFKGFAGNRDLESYMRYHYVPSDIGRFSNTMEYSFDDWTVGQLAKAIGDEQAYKTFNDRGYWWRNVISDEGYCHLKDSQGRWMENFDPFRSGANWHYVEGNAWQLTFFVPQDVPALVEKIGKDKFNERLLWGFSQDEAWRYNAPNDQYWDHPVVQGNQQSMHFAYLFNYSGQPWNTQRWSRSILERYYGCGIANAYLGDEDQGQMSAWAVMTAIGLFQMDGGASAAPTYEIASPAYEEITIYLGGRYGRGEKFVIKAAGASKKNIYVQSARLNGKDLKSFRFPASELLGGGILELEMGPEPNYSWGIE